MLTIGCHLSSSKGYLAMGKEAVSIGANTFQFFYKKPERKQGESHRRGGCRTFLSYSKEHGIERIFGTCAVHAESVLEGCAHERVCMDDDGG